MLSAYFPLFRAFILGDTLISGGEFKKKKIKKKNKKHYKQVCLAINDTLQILTLSLFCSTKWILPALNYYDVKVVWNKF